ncbi:helix-turn-helix transcriptional regulator [Peribacillus simplex]|uniref:helix-turn-helix domain-containing protein n=2 Tax=Peribacillus simplex TaxID=1478 RepID=UPI00298E4B7B|nr:helix-turn-helix transcriptional regulator [Peribacillus simplex]MDW7615165.1 helix-turn-helix transcriptional regulator [Peribacillus simplex]
MSTLMVLVGKKIKNIRKQKNMTQEELSEKCGLQTSFLAGVERGERNITIQTLEKIIDGLNEEPKNLFIFSNIELTEDYQSKKEMITLIDSLLLEKSEKEIKMINSIIRNIFDTYNK